MEANHAQPCKSALTVLLKRGKCFLANGYCCLISWVASGADLRLRERGRMWGELRPPSSSVMLSVLPKCLDKKWSSSMVGWEGSWCSRS